MLLVDRSFVDPSRYGLEQFGARNPRIPLPASPLPVERSGRFVGLRDTRTPVSDPVAIGAFADPTPLDWLTDADRVVVAVGDTWAMELSWAALWGRAELDPLPPVADPRLMAPRVPAVGAARGASGAET